MTTVVSRVRDDLTGAVAGQGGDGSLTLIGLLPRLLRPRGFHLYSARSVASRIKGGHAAALLRASHADRGGLGAAVDVLVLLGKQGGARPAARPLQEQPRLFTHKKAKSSVTIHGE